MPKQSLHQKLLQKLSPQQIKLMKLIQLSTIELENRIDEELSENPALEDEKLSSEDEVNSFESEDEYLAINFIRKNYDALNTCDLHESNHSGLRAWFGKGKKGGAGGGGWDRYNTKGERIGKCGDRKKGEGKPKCLSKARAASLRASGGKKAIAAAVNRKRRKDKNPERRGKAINVRNKKKK